jgi:hypothetical protein
VINRSISGIIISDIIIGLVCDINEKSVNYLYTCINESIMNRGGEGRVQLGLRESSLRIRLTSLPRSPKRVST